jgi:hypothetical protein
MSFRTFLAHVGLLLFSASGLGIREAEAQPPTLQDWKLRASVSVVSPNERHSIHAYYLTSPESPDGRKVLFYASTTADGHVGELRIRDRLTGQETIVARNVAVEDAHRAACQQWISNGRRIVFHNIIGDEDWTIGTVDLPDGEVRTLARGRQLGFGAALHDLVPVYGPHWNPGEHCDLELLNVATGEIHLTGLTAAAVRQRYSDWVIRQFGDKPISIFFPVLSPDRTRVICKIATPAGGHFRSSQASERFGLIGYDFLRDDFLFLNEQWGHPAWHANSRDLIETARRVIDSSTGHVHRIPGEARFRGDHPSFSPDGRLYTTDTLSDGVGGPKGYCDVIVGDVTTGEIVTVHRFDNSRGAQSWRVSHPHPAFSPDGRRLYFNVSDGPWTRLHVADTAP